METLQIPKVKWQGELFRDYPLARHTSWHIGGPADHLYVPTSLEDCQRFMRWAYEQAGLPVRWLGLGSNVLIHDCGIRGAVLLPKHGLKSLTIDGPSMRVEAGVSCAKLAKFCVKHGAVQGAFFAGIPGTMGGALAMNAGAYGHETCVCDACRSHGTRWDAHSDGRQCICLGVSLCQRFTATIGLQRPTWPFLPLKIIVFLPSIKAYLAKREATQPIGTKIVVLCLKILKEIMQRV